MPGNQPPLRTRRVLGKGERQPSSGTGVAQVLRKERQEEQEFKTHLGYEVPGHRGCMGTCLKEQQNKIIN